MVSISVCVTFDLTVPLHHLTLSFDNMMNDELGKWLCFMSHKSYSVCPLYSIENLSEENVFIDFCVFVVCFFTFRWENCILQTFCTFKF